MKFYETDIIIKKNLGTYMKIDMKVLQIYISNIR